VADTSTSSYYVAVSNPCGSAQSNVVGIVGECVPVTITQQPIDHVIGPARLLYADSGITLEGYGQDRLINVGATQSEMMINPHGHGPLMYTDDGGSTWTPIDYSSNTNLRLCQDIQRIANNHWWILGYRPDNRADRSWYELDPPSGSWAFLNNHDLSYNHGVYYQNENTFWRYDGNNSGPGVLRKYIEQVVGTPSTFTSLAFPESGQRNAWAHRRVGNDLFIAYEVAGALEGFMVWDIQSDVPVYVAHNDSVGPMLNMVSDGTAICITTGNLGLSPQNVVIQSLNRNGTFLDSEMNFGVDVRQPCAEYANSVPIITAIEEADRTKMRYGFGTSGTHSGSITLPYPASTSDGEREIRYLGSDKYAIAYEGVVGSTDPCLVVIETEL
jgi:hypothetical protein